MTEDCLHAELGLSPEDCLSCSDEPQEPTFAITVEVPVRLGSWWVDKFYVAVGDAAYDIQNDYDEYHPGKRDWDILVYACGPLPEQFDDDDSGVE